MSFCLLGNQCFFFFFKAPKSVNCFFEVSHDPHVFIT